MKLRFHILVPLLFILVLVLLMVLPMAAVPVAPTEQVALNVVSSPGNPSESLTSRLIPGASNETLLVILSIGGLISLTVVAVRSKLFNYGKFRRAYNHYFAGPDAGGTLKCPIPGQA